MLTNFYKAVVYVKRDSFETDILRNKIKLDNFYDKLNETTSRNEIARIINELTNDEAFDGLYEIYVQVKRPRNNNSHPLYSIDRDYRFNIENYLSYLEMDEEIKDLPFEFSLNRDFIFKLFKELAEKSKNISNQQIPNA